MRARDLAASPTVDLSKTGDILFTNAFVDNVLGTQEGFIRATALLYANGRDLKDPLLSPIYGDVHGFPPSILTSGTRDLYLSNTVRLHRKLRASGVEAVLQIWEGRRTSPHPRRRNITTKSRISSTDTCAEMLLRLRVISQLRAATQLGRLFINSRQLNRSGANSV
jgi:acetyl esterase/lipase